MISLYIGNSMQLSLSSLAAADGAAVDSAVVQATLYDTDGITELAGASWPMSMPYASGEYSAALPATLQVVEGGIYYARITATVGSVVFKEELWVKAEKRVAQS